MPPLYKSYCSYFAHLAEIHLNIRVHLDRMAVKTITITQKAYDILKSKKKGEESFSDVILRSYGAQKSLSDLHGSLKDDPDIDKLYARVMNERLLRRTAARQVFEKGKKYDSS